MCVFVGEEIEYGLLGDTGKLLLGMIMASWLCKGCPFPLRLLLEMYPEVRGDFEMVPKIDRYISME